MGDEERAIRAELAARGYAGEQVEVRILGDPRARVRHWTVMLWDGQGHPIRPPLVGTLAEVLAKIVALPAA